MANVEFFGTKQRFVGVPDARSARNPVGDSRVPAMALSRVVAMDKQADGRGREGKGYSKHGFW